MTYTRRWAAGSFDDVQAGADWYDERQSGLGAQFAAEVLATTERAVRRPLVFKVYEHGNLPAHGEFRKAQLKRFDEYGVIFTLVDDTLWIVAVAHAKRRPGYWTNRLNDVPLGDQ